MMPDREKVIGAWEIFRKSNPYEICNGREFRAFAEPEYCMGQMIEDTISMLKEQDKLVNVDKLREKLGFAESCEKCKKDSWRCVRDTYFTETNFCVRLDLAIEELTQEGR